MIAGTVPYQHAGTPAWLIPARLPLWYMEAIASMYTILASIGCGPHVSSQILYNSVPIVGSWGHGMHGSAGGGRPGGVRQGRRRWWSNILRGYGIPLPFLTS